ncbi:MAG: guanylate kinase [Bacilli bacterium]|nr:guanylate kinase [Bacilli bacterium]
MQKGLLIIISGPSGVGKGTVRRRIMEDDSLNLSYSVSMTTRAPRNKEVDGVDYFFVSNEEFDRNLQNDNFLEWANFVGNRYGTPKDYVEKLREEGKNVILEIEIEGAQQVLSKCQGNDVISIFLMPPSIEQLEARIRGRKSESEEIIQERLAKARREMSSPALKYQYHYIVYNDRVERASDEIKNIIKSKLNAKITK